VIAAKLVAGSSIGGPDVEFLKAGAAGRHAKRHADESARLFTGGLRGSAGDFHIDGAVAEH
jgi:hypothetical protein